MIIEWAGPHFILLLQEVSRWPPALSLARLRSACELARHIGFHEDVAAGVRDRTSRHLPRTLSTDNSSACSLEPSTRATQDRASLRNHNNTEKHQTLNANTETRRVMRRAKGRRAAVVGGRTPRPAQGARHRPSRANARAREPHMALRQAAMTSRHKHRYL